MSKATKCTEMSLTEVCVTRLMQKLKNRLHPEITHPEEQHYLHLFVQSITEYKIVRYSYPMRLHWMICTFKTNHTSKIQTAHWHCHIMRIHVWLVSSRNSSVWQYFVANTVNV